MKLLIIPEERYDAMLAEKRAAFKNVTFPDTKNILHGTLAGFGALRAAMTEVDLDDMDFECGWGMKKCSAYLLARIKGAA